MAKKIELDKKIEITLQDRITLTSLLPAEGDYAFFIIKKDLINKVAVTQDELKTSEIKEIKATDGRGSHITWNAKGSTSKFGYDFTDLEKNEIKLALQKISNEKKLQEYQLNLYEIFAK